MTFDLCPGLFHQNLVNFGCITAAATSRLHLQNMNRLVRVLLHKKRAQNIAKLNEGTKTLLLDQIREHDRISELNKILLTLLSTRAAAGAAGSFSPTFVFSLPLLFLFHNETKWMNYALRLLSSLHTHHQNHWQMPHSPNQADSIASQAEVMAHVSLLVPMELFVVAVVRCEPAEMGMLLQPESDWDFDMVVEYDRMNRHWDFGSYAGIFPYSLTWIWTVTWSFYACVCVDLYFWISAFSHSFLCSCFYFCDDFLNSYAYPCACPMLLTFPCHVHSYDLIYP
jgi:hypothetical protein